MSKNILQTLQEMEQDGTLKALVDASFLPCTTYFKLEVLKYFDAQKRTTKKGTTKIVGDAAIIFGVSDDTIYKIIRKLKQV